MSIKTTEINIIKNVHYDERFKSTVYFTIRYQLSLFNVPVYWKILSERQIRVMKHRLAMPIKFCNFNECLSYVNKRWVAGYKPNHTRQHVVKQIKINNNEAKNKTT